MSEWETLDRALAARFAVAPRYHVRAPGRVNLIGEHTDYNEGFVLPVAIDRSVRIAAAAGATLDPHRLAHLAHRAEVEFVRVRCGIMDQLAVALGRRDDALLIDCRSLDISPVPIPRHWTLLVCDTGVRRALGDSAYNDRRRECDVAVAALRHARPALRTLRDLGPEDLPLLEDLPEVLARRARHVIMENRRVLDAVDALRRQDGAAVGRLLEASHASLRDDFEVSIPELDAMVAAVRAAGALGARLTGAGFGGAVIALVARPAVETVVASARAAYRKAAGREGTFLICAPADGAALEEVTTAPG